MGNISSPVFGLASLLMPEEGPKAIPVSFDFSLFANQIFDQIGILQDAGVIQYIQTLYVDNSLNNQVLIITEDLTGQRIVIQAKAQGYVPVIAPKSKPIFRFATTPAANLNVNIQFINLPLSPELWGGTASTKGDAMVLLGEVTVTNAASINVTQRLDNSAIFQTDYDDYQIELMDIVNITNSVHLYLHVTKDGGLTWEAGTSYNVNCAAAGGGFAILNADNQSQIPLNYTPTAPLDNTKNTPLRGTLFVRNPLTTSNFKTIQGMLSYYGDQLINMWPNGMYKSTANQVNGIQLICSAGNISGTARVYGLSK